MDCRELGQAATVGELRKLLGEFADDMPLVVEYDSNYTACAVSTKILIEPEPDKTGWGDTHYAPDDVHERRVKAVVVLS